MYDPKIHIFDEFIYTTLYTAFIVPDIWSYTCTVEKCTGLYTGKLLQDLMKLPKNIKMSPILESFMISTTLHSK